MIQKKFWSMKNYINNKQKLIKQRANKKKIGKQN